MRLRVETKIKSDYLCFNYQSLVVSLIKKALSTEDINYFNELYQPNDGKPKTKGFSFSANITNFKAIGSGVDVKITGDNLIINISTIDMKFAIILYNALLKMRDEDFVFRNTAIRVIKITRLKEFEIDSDVVEFRTLSPIYLKKKVNGKDHPVDVDDIDYYTKVLNYISNTTLKEIRGYGLKQELQFMPIEYKKIISQQKYSSQSNKLKSLYKTVYKGNFVLRGNVNDLKDLYKMGIGFSRNLGFGALEVVRCL